MDKEKTVTIIVILATLMLAGIAVFTALRLYQRGSQPVSPAAPASQPSADEEGKACEALIFSLTEEASPTPTQVPGEPTNTPVPSSTPSPTNTPTNTPTATPTQSIGGESEPSATPTPTNTPTSTPTPSPTQGEISSNDPSPTPTQSVGGESEPTPTDSRIAQANSPTPTDSGGIGGTTEEELPPAGSSIPTLFFGMGSILLILIGLVLAF